MFLRDQAQGHHLAMVMRVVAQELGDRLLGLEPLEGPTGRELLGMDPRQWQESTPLMTRLVSLACAETQGSARTVRRLPFIWRSLRVGEVACT